jgi:hypothetical protein
MEIVPNNPIGNMTKNMFNTCNETLKYLQTILHDLPDGIKMVLSECLLTTTRSPYLTGILLSKKIMNILSKKTTISISSNEMVKIPCINKSLDVLKKIVTTSNTNPTLYSSSSLCACLIGSVLILDVLHQCTKLKLIIDSKQYIQCQEYLQIFFDKYMISESSSSSLLTPHQSKWIFTINTKQQIGHEYEDNSTYSKLLLNKLKEKYLPCPSQLLATILLEYPTSDVDNSFNDISPPPKKFKRENNISTTTSIDGNANETCPHAIVQSLLNEPKPMVSSRTGTGSHKVVLTTTTSQSTSILNDKNLAQKSQPVRCSNNPSTSLFSEFNSIFKSPVKHNVANIIPATPDAILQAAAAAQNKTN